MSFNFGAEMNNRLGEMGVIPYKKQNLLFIGGPKDSLPTLGRAKALGYGVYVVDGSSIAPGLCWVRKHGLDGAAASVYDAEAIIKEVQRNQWRPDGVMAVGVDCGWIVSTVAKFFDLPHIPIEITELSHHKPSLKERLRAGGVAVPGSADFVVKPVDGRGSRGVYTISASYNGHFAPFAIASREHSPSGQVMFEAYVPGSGVSAEAVVWEGQVIFCGLTDRLYSSPRSVVEYGGTGDGYPWSLPDPARHWVLEGVKLCSR